MEKKRGSLFTVQDAESAIITYTVLGLLYIIGICLYELVVGWNGILQMLKKLEATSPVFNRATIAFIIFKGIIGFGIPILVGLGGKTALVN